MRTFVQCGRAAVLLVLPLVGIGCGCCGGSGVRTGWRFEVMKPPALSAETLVQSSGATLGLCGHNVSGLGEEVMSSHRFRLASVLGALPGPTEDSELLAIILQRIEQRLGQLERGGGARMPTAGEAVGPPSKRPPETAGR